ncbi:UNVERIFIED_ORG: type I restriction enzyme S subunit [Comamonas terrigena]
MDAQQFLAEFGHIASAPGGIGQLRKLILDLAIRGKLLPSTHSTDATLLLSEIAALRSELVKTGELRRHTPLPPIGADEIAFQIPDGWAFERLGNVCEIVRGITFPASKKLTSQADGAVACLRTTNIQTALDWSNLIYIDPEFVGRSDQWVEVGDTMISMANSYELVGKVALVKDVPQRATFGGFIAVVRPHVLEPEYLYLVLRSPYMQAKMRATSSQTTNIANISLGGMRPIPMPIPPKDEQSRIVAKVDQLMALCDQLERLQQDRRKLQKALRQSTLQALSSAESPHELQESWQRLQANFGRLFSEPADVRDFKGLVLDLAVSGRLLPTPAAPSLAADLICQIEEARNRWMVIAQDQEKKEAVAVQKKLRTQIATTPSSALPAHWCWASLLQISQVVVDCDHKTPVYSADGIHLVRTTDIRDGEMLLHATKKVSEEVYIHRSRRLTPRPGDIFFTREAPMGEAAIVPEGQRVALGQRLMLIRLFGNLVNPKFLIYVMQSPSFKGRLVGSAVGMTVQHINVSDVETLQIPLPPKVEQDRIVQLLEDVLGRVGQLTAQLARGRKTAESLAISGVEALTGISVELTEETVVKAPPTELIAPLRLGTLPDVKDQAPLATLLARHQGEMPARDLWQRFGGEIDAFYAQLKTEVAHGWITEPPVAEVRAKPVEVAEA